MKRNGVVLVAACLLAAWAPICVAEEASGFSLGKLLPWSQPAEPERETIQQRNPRAQRESSFDRLAEGTKDFATGTKNVLTAPFKKVSYESKQFVNKTRSSFGSDRPELSSKRPSFPLQQRKREKKSSLFGWFEKDDPRPSPSLQDWFSQPRP